MSASRSRNYPGRLIAVEGLDGSGKSTQVYLLKRWLELEGYKVFFTEWNSSPLVRRATRRGKRQKTLTPSTFALIHATDFADRYERQILPLLHAGYLVLADRYVYTAYARDGVRGCDRTWIRKLYSFARVPDVTFFFRVPLETALNRILEGRPRLKWYEAGMDLELSLDPYESFRIFQGRIHDEYLRMASEYGFVTIDASRPADAQQQDVRTALQSCVDLERYRWRYRPLEEAALWAQPL